MNKRGQAAMEFLMTYGWALLIVLVAIAVLAAMGVFSGSRFGANLWLLQPAFSGDGVARSNGQIQMQVTQGTGTDLTSFAMYLSNGRVGGTPACGTTPGARFQIQGTVTTFPDGSTQTFTQAAGAGACSATELTAGSRVQFDLIAAYTQGGISHLKIGTWRTNVEAV